MSTDTIPVDESEHKHPIRQEIVFELSDEYCLHSRTINAVLDACEELWEPHRSEFAQVLHEMENNFEFRLDIYEFPNEGVTVISDDSITPIDLLSRMNIDFYLSETHVSKLAMAHVIFTAHKLESQRLMDEPADSPVVIRTPEK